MRKALGLAVSILMFASSCKKDLLHWHQVQRLDSHTTKTLYHLRFTNTGACLAAGGERFQDAIVTRSTDGGYTWTTNSYPQAGKAMVGMGATPLGTLYLCGVDGQVLKSADNGATWKQGRIDDWQQYVGASFGTEDTGVFVATVLQKQGTITVADSALKIVSQHTYLFGLNDVYMLNGSTGYVIGYGTVLKTTDHCATWNFQDVKGDNFTAMDVHGDEIWMCGANGGIYHTTDAGNHWHTLRNGNDISLPRYFLRSLLFKDSQHGWAVGDEGRVIYTDDGGMHWSEYDRFTTSALRSIAMCPNGDLLTAGDDGVLYRIVP